MKRVQTVVDKAAAALHAIHGTRGMAIAVGLLLLWVLLEAGLRSDPDAAPLVLALLFLLVAAMATLPREGVAMQARARALAHRDDAWRVLLRRAPWLLLLLVLLSPRVFLGAYGIPHFNPLTGVVEPSIMQRITTVYLFAVLLLAVLYIRSTRREAPDILSKRPADLRDGSGSHLARQGLQAALLVLLVVWLVLLRGAWASSGIAQWPPTAAAFASANGAASLAFAAALPAMLYLALASHMEFLWALWRNQLLRGQVAAAWISAGMAGGTAWAAYLHARTLLWVSAFQDAGIV